jgi:hypothetical protein
MTKPNAAASREASRVGSRERDYASPARISERKAEGVSYRV